MKLTYQLFMPQPDFRGSTMLDAYGGETPNMRRYECVYAGEVDVEPHRSGDARVAEAMTPLHACELLWRRHNVGDVGDENRPRPQDIRSMCVGDIIRFDHLNPMDTHGPTVFVAESAGFRPLVGGAVPLYLDDARPWQDVNHRDLPRIILR